MLSVFLTRRRKKIISDKSMKTLANKGFKPLILMHMTASRTVVFKGLDPIITGVPADDIQRDSEIRTTGSKSTK